jgi:hypothetical protein
MIMKNNIYNLLLIVAVGFSPSLWADSAREYQCSGYAGTAVEQNRDNIRFECGYNGPRWNANRKGQEQWCLTVSGKVSDQENEIRDKMLQQCYKRKTSLDDTENQINIPASCKDLKRGYIPVRYIYSHSSYNEAPYPFSPISMKDGYIHFDFNQDGIDDYIFIERGKDTPILLAQCMSDANNLEWQRKTIQALEGEATEPDFSVRYSRVSVDDKGVLSIGDHHHEHNWGSDSRINEYIYDVDKKAFQRVRLLESSQSGDGMRDDYEKIIDYRTGWVTKKTNCAPMSLDENRHCRDTTTRTRISEEDNIK